MHACMRVPTHLVTIMTPRWRVGGPRFDPRRPPQVMTCGDGGTAVARLVGTGDSRSGWH